MCLIAWRWLPDSATPLTWAANRDEFAHRATGALQHWGIQKQTILSGVDLALEPVNRLLGTWSGVNAAGQFAWLTNIRDPQHANPQAPSRGLLVSQYLAAPATPTEYAASVAAKAMRYNGFNLILGQLKTATRPAQCVHFNSATGRINVLSAGVYGLSNADLDTPWPKTRHLVRVLSLAAAAQFDSKLDTKTLFTALANTQRSSGKDLPSTGVPLETEHVLSSAFIATTIRGTEYGTRSSTVGWVHADRFEVHERSFNAQGLCNNTAIETLQLS